MRLASPRIRSMLVLAVVLAVASPAAGAAGSWVEAQAPAPARQPAAPQRADTLAERVKRLADDYMRAYFEHYPEEATLNGSRDARDDRFTDPSDSALASWQRFEDRTLASLRALDLSGQVGSVAWVTHGVLREKLEADVAMRACRRELWNLDAMQSWMNDQVQLALRQPVGTAARRTAALTRWRGFPTVVRAEIARLRTGIALGYTAPYPIAAKVTNQVEALLATPLEQSPFTSAAQRANDVDFGVAMRETVRDSVLPAVRAYHDFLAGEYQGQARTTLGVGALPHGDACFQAIIRRYTTLDWSVQDVDSIGRQLLADAEAARARVAWDRYGVRDGRLLMERLASDPRFTFRSTTEMLVVSRAALARAQAAVPRWFGHVPYALVPQVDTFPASVGASGPTGQAFAAVGARAESRYSINAEHLRYAGGKLMIEQLAFHEAVPGHLLQGLIQLERPDAHPVTRYFWQPALGEGWGMYAQELAEEMGLYSAEAYRVPLLDLRVLSGVAFVVTTGIHAHGWTREQALDTLAAHLAWTPERLEYQVDYLAGSPGQALAYSAGLLEIRRLRAEAERALGPAWDPRAFHDVVLADGTVPLPMLRAKVERWIRQRLAGPGAPVGARQPR